MKNALFKVELSVVGPMTYVNQNWRSLIMMVMANYHHNLILRADGTWINKLRDPDADKVISHFCAGRPKNRNAKKRPEFVIINFIIL